MPKSRKAAFQDEETSVSNVAGLYFIDMPSGSNHQYYKRKTTNFYQKFIVKSRKAAFAALRGGRDPVSNVAVASIIDMPSGSDRQYYNHKTTNFPLKFKTVPKRSKIAVSSLQSPVFSLESWLLALDSPPTPRSSPVQMTRDSKISLFEYIHAAKPKIVQNTPNMKVDIFIGKSRLQFPVSSPIAIGLPSIF